MKRAGNIYTAEVNNSFCKFGEHLFLKATGSIDDLRNGTYLDCVSNNCTYGIYYDYQVNPNSNKLKPRFDGSYIFAW